MQDKYVLQGMLHPLTFDIDLHVFSFMIAACNTIFGEGPPDLQHNAATSNNIHEQLFYKMQTLQFSLENDVLCVCVDLHEFCQQDTDGKAPGI